MILFAIALAAAAADHPKELLGRWQMEVSAATTFELRADGNAQFNGEATRWTARAGKLTVGGTTMDYKLAGARLTLSMGSADLVWVRAAGKAAAARERMPPVRIPESDDAAPPVEQHRGDPRLRQLLLSNAWCSFHYSQSAGTSSKTRVSFGADGSALRQSDSELSSSGSGGQYGSQQQGGEQWRWEIRGQRLFIDTMDGQGARDVGLAITQNSNGYPILNAGGKEYMSCK